MKGDERVSVVVPAFNEAPVIERVVEDVMGEVIDRLPGSELIVVDDCSSDETPVLLARLATRHPALRVLRAEVNRGHGPCVVTGLDAAARPWIFLMDSDAQFDVADFWKLWSSRGGNDVVMGCRSERADPRHRLVLSTIVSVVASRLARRPLPDANVPFKLLRRGVWSDLRPEVGTAPRAPSIMLAVGAALRGWRIESVPVAHFARPHGRSKLRAVHLVRFSLAGLRELRAFSRRVAQRDGEISPSAQERAPTSTV